MKLYKYVQTTLRMRPDIARRGHVRAVHEFVSVALLTFIRLLCTAVKRLMYVFHIILDRCRLLLSVVITYSEGFAVTC